MYTLDIKQTMKQMVIMLGGTVFTAVFGAIYELFSHQVYSYFMIYAFAVPLALGVIPYAISLLRGKMFTQTFASLWNRGVATLTVGSVFTGVLEIYGTTNRLICIYPAAAAVLLLAGILSIIFPFFGKREKNVIE